MLSNDTSFNNVIIIQPPINIQLENDTSSNKPINPFASTQRSNSNLVLYNPNTNVQDDEQSYKIGIDYFCRAINISRQTNLSNT